MTPRARDRELPLFDLPLHEGAPKPDEESDPSVALDETEARSASREEPVENLRLFEEEAQASREDLEAEEERDERDVAADSGPVLMDRLLSGLADLGVQVLALVAGGLGALWLGAPATLESWPAFLGLAGAFSFLYWVIPLAFWGRTPGMAWVGHSARTMDFEPLSFGQAGWRWMGALLTLALAGLPQIFSFGGRSLSDRLSSSLTIVDSFSAD